MFTFLFDANQSASYQDNKYMMKHHRIKASKMLQCEKVTLQLMTFKRSAGGSLVKSSVVSNRDTSPWRQHWDFTRATYHSYKINPQIFIFSKRGEKGKHHGSALLLYLICNNQLRSRWRIPIKGVWGHRCGGAAGVRHGGSEPVQKRVEPLMPRIKQLYSKRFTSSMLFTL